MAMRERRGVARSSHSILAPCRESGVDKHLRGGPPGRLLGKIPRPPVAPCARCAGARTTSLHPRAEQDAKQSWHAHTHTQGGCQTSAAAGESAGRTSRILDQAVLNERARLMATQQSAWRLQAARRHILYGARVRGLKKGAWRGRCTESARMQGEECFLNQN